MIIGFSHISQSCKEIDSKAKILVAQGFEQKFINRYLLNHPNKRPLVRGGAFPDLHSIGLFYKTDSVDTELIEYENISEVLCTRYKIDDQSIIIQTNQIAEEITFWRNALRCKEVGQHHLKFTSFVASWNCDFVFQKTDQPLQKAMLNDSGLNCIAFYVKNLNALLSKLISHDAVLEVAPFEIEVNNKNLTVAMLRSPDGNIIELIEVKNG